MRQRVRRPTIEVVFSLESLWKRSCATFSCEFSKHGACQVVSVFRKSLVVRVIELFYIFVHVAGPWWIVSFPDALSGVRNFGADTAVLAIRSGLWEVHFQGELHPKQAGPDGTVRRPLGGALVNGA